MNHLWRYLLAAAILSYAGSASAQYLRIQTDNPSDSTRLNASGTTLLTIILDTNHDRDGSLQTCNSHTVACGAAVTSRSLNVFGYTVLMTASSGTVSWGMFTPADAAYSSLQPQVSDSVDVEFVFQRPAGTFSPEGVNTLGTIPVTVLSGAPHINIVRSISLDPFAPPTNFNTQCDGFSFPNSYVLGNPSNPCSDPIGAGDWFDADGVAAPADLPPQVQAPGSVDAIVGTQLSVSVTAHDPNGDAIDSLFADLSRLPNGNDANFRPAPDHLSGRLTWTPSLSDTGTYLITFTAMNSLIGSATTTSRLLKNGAGRGNMLL